MEYAGKTGIREAKQAAFLVVNGTLWSQAESRDVKVTESSVKPGFHDGKLTGRQPASFMEIDRIYGRDRDRILPKSSGSIWCKGGRAEHRPHSTILVTHLAMHEQRREAATTRDRKAIG